MGRLTVDPVAAQETLDTQPQELHGGKRVNTKGKVGVTKRMQSQRKWLTAAKTNKQNTFELKEISEIFPSIEGAKDKCWKMMQI